MNISIFTCGSIIRGHLSELDNIVAFSVDIKSLGNPSFCHFAIIVSSVRSESGSKFSVNGTLGYKSKRLFAVKTEFNFTNI